MKATGIVRRIDDLGRIVIPKEIRRTLRIKEVCECKGLIGLTAFILIGYVGLLASPVNMSLAQKLMPEFKSMISGFIGGFSWGVIGILLPFISILAEKFGFMNVLLAMTLIPFIFAYYIKDLPKE